MRGRLLVALFVLGLIGVGAAVAGANRNWSVHANGGQEVPARDSRGQAQAIFHLSQDGSELEYKLVAADIENVFMAHIHMQTPGVNGRSACGSTRRPRRPPGRSARGARPASLPRA